MLTIIHPSIAQAYHTGADLVIKIGPTSAWSWLKEHGLARYSGSSSLEQGCKMQKSVR